MSYTDLSTIRKTLIQGVKLNESTTLPSKEWADIEIPLVDGEVNVALKTGGATVPVTDTDLLAALKGLCTKELVYRALTIRGSKDKDADGSSSLWVNWHKEYANALALMRSGDFFQDPAEETDVPHSYTEDAEEDPDNLSIQPKFSLDQSF